VELLQALEGRSGNWAALRPFEGGLIAHPRPRYTAHHPRRSFSRAVGETDNIGTPSPKIRHSEPALPSIATQTAPSVKERDVPKRTHAPQQNDVRHTVIVALS